MFDAVFLTTIVLATAASLLCWTLVVTRLLQRRPILPYQPCNPVPWGFVDLALVLFILFASTLVAQLVFASIVGKVGSEQLSPREQAWQLLIHSAAYVGTIVLSVAALVVRHATTLRDLGIVKCGMWRDLRLGVIAFFVLAPLVYGLQIILVQWLESKHPIIEMLKKDPSPDFVIAAIVSAVVVAPVFEEYLIRLLFQGWLQKFADFQADPVPIWLGRGPSPRADSKAGTDSQPAPIEGNATLPATGTQRPVAFWPVLASSLLFSLLHYSHGVDWIPLFLLAVGLGILYRQTHRILPCIVVHFLLNAFSMAMCLLEVMNKR